MKQFTRRIILLMRENYLIKFSTVFPILIICFGAFLRIHHYLYNRSLWLDEAMLAISIVNRSFTGLLEPLDYIQQAPVGFLMLERLSVEIFGPSEYALRLPSLIFGILSLLLFYEVSRRYISSNAVPFALAFFAISNSLIRYSSELKQYSADVAVCLLIYLMIYHVQASKLSTSKTIIFGVTGALVIWFSFPSIFVLAGGAISLTIFYFNKRNWTALSKVLISYMIWLLSFVINYQLFIGNNLDKNGALSSLEEYWEKSFAPFPIFSPISETAKWYLATFENIFQSPVGFALPGLAGMIFLTGCFWMSRRNKYSLFIILSAIGITLLASLMQKYPFDTGRGGGRLILFLVPSIIMIIAEGVEYFRLRLHRMAFLFMIVLLLLKPIAIPIYYLKSPRRPEVRPIIEYVLKNQDSSGIIYIYYGAHPQFIYYRELLGFQEVSYVLGTRSREDWSKYIEDIENIRRDHNRVWFLFSHVKNNEKEFFLNQLGVIGSQLDLVEAHGASAYLYDLSKSSPRGDNTVEMGFDCHWTKR